MARRDDIATAFRSSIKIADNGKRTVTTADFVDNLAKANHNFTLAEANLWIEHYQSNFRDISTEEGGNRKFHLFNPNGGGY